MDPHYHLGWVDYIVIGISLLISLVIGLVFRFSGNRQKTTREYLMAGKNMSMFPVIMSITVTMLSAVTMLGMPMESYRYGLQLAFIVVPFSIGTILAAYIMIPVYFNCRVSTSYEYLELRYGKTTRYAISSLFLIQMIFFMSVVLYAPVLALSAVTDLSMEASIVIFGLVCSLYCAIGGLKAVLWTDVFQSVLMLLCLIVVYSFGVGEAGGVGKIYKTAAAGQRINIFDFTVDFTTRYTFLNVFGKGFIAALAFYGTSQVEVQRVLSLSTFNKAKAALCWSVIPVSVLVLMCNLLGLVLFTIFNTCDPVKDKAHTGITNYDQVLPYYIVTRLHTMPGLTGLCIAGIFSGSLSSISSALNSLSTVTVMDFIKPLCKCAKLTETKTVCIAKALSLFYGLICIAFTFAITKLDSLVAVNNALMGIMDGPLLAIYLVGMLTRKGSEKCILFGLASGFALTGWIGYGIVFGGHRYPSLPLDTSGCSSSFNSSDIFQNLTSVCEDLGQCPSTVPPIITPPRGLMKYSESGLLVDYEFEIDANVPMIIMGDVNVDVKRNDEVFNLYRVSFIWISAIGCFLTLCCIFIAILFTGWSHNAIPADSKCLSPITRFWMKETSQSQGVEVSEERAALTAALNEAEKNKIEIINFSTKV